MPRLAVPAASAALLLIASAALLLTACATTTAVRYTDASGKAYRGVVDPLRDVVSADINGNMYRGPLRVNNWGQVKTTLAAPGRDPLYCEFAYRVLKVKGTCTDLAGGDYVIQSE